MPQWLYAPGFDTVGAARAWLDSRTCRVLFVKPFCGASRKALTSLQDGFFQKYWCRFQRADLLEGAIASILMPSVRIVSRTSRLPTPPDVIQSCFENIESIVTDSVTPRPDYRKTSWFSDPKKSFRLRAALGRSDVGIWVFLEYLALLFRWSFSPTLTPARKIDEICGAPQQKAAS